MTTITATTRERSGSISATVAFPSDPHPPPCCWLLSIMDQVEAASDTTNCSSTQSRKNNNSSSNNNRGKSGKRKKELLEKKEERLPCIKVAYADIAGICFVSLSSTIESSSPHAPLIPFHATNVRCPRLSVD